jgi:probable phosphoglycerate mutase
VSHRYLYLACHGDAVSEDAGLGDRGRRQAELLGDRLADVPFASVTHSPLPRAVETAAPWPQAQPSEVVGDYPPWVPADVPAPYAMLTGGWSDAELRAGPKLAEQALARFAVPAEQETYELVITHSFPPHLRVR